MGCCSDKDSKNTNENSSKKEKKLTIDELKQKYGKTIVDLIVGEQIQKINEIIAQGFKPDMLFDIGIFRKTHILFTKKGGGYESTMLIISIAYKKDKVTQNLLNHSQNVNIEVGDGPDSALICAVDQENYDIINLLLQKGAKKNIKLNNGFEMLDIINKKIKQKQQKNDEQGVENLEKIKSLFK